MGHGSTAVGRLRELLPAICGLLVLALSLWSLYHLAQGFEFRAVFQQLRSLPGGALPLALALTAASYAIHTVYDYFGCRWIGHPVPYRQLWLASFIGYAFGNTIGLPVVSGGSVRYRLYATWGLSAAQVTAVVLFCALTFGLGGLLMLGLTMVLSPGPLLGFSLQAIRLAGVGVLGLLLIYLALNAWVTREWRLWSWRLKFPGVEMTLAQMGLAAITIALDATVIYLLLPPAAGVGHGEVVSAFVLATVLGHVSQVPGGFGILEASMLVLLPSAARGPLLAALVLFRFVYHLLPLLAAVICLGAYELLHERGWLRAALRSTPLVSQQLLPQFTALTASAAGTLLVLGGAIAPPAFALARLQHLPLALVEIAHILGSLLGLELLLLAPLLDRGDRKAAHWATWALALGLVCSLVRGFALVQAAILLVLLLTLLAACRSLATGVSRSRPVVETEWLLTLGTTLLASLFLALFSFPYLLSDGALWFKVNLMSADARVLRTTAVVMVTAAVAIIIRSSPHRSQ